MPDSQPDQSVNDPSGNPAAAYSASSLEDHHSTGMEPVLGGSLAEKAVWVDEAVCIGCRPRERNTCSQYKQPHLQNEHEGFLHQLLSIQLQFECPSPYKSL